MLDADSLNAGAVVAVERLTAATLNAWMLHDHDTHQLTWTPAGVVSIATEHHNYLVPPTMGLWLPAGVPHTTSLVRDAPTYFVFFDPDSCPVEWSTPTVFSVNALAAELITYLDRAVEASLRVAAETLLCSQLTPIASSEIEVQLPTDARARDVAIALLADPGDDRDLIAWADAVGASARTISRGFATGTGMSFGSWRTQVRLRSAMIQLRDGRPVAQVARAVGYGSTSSFIAVYRRFMGATPRASVRAN